MLLVAETLNIGLLLNRYALRIGVVEIGSQVIPSVMVGDEPTYKETELNRIS